ncbi:MAG: UvrB/UvrC motif-containing protein [Limnochordia bacterium]|jgi:protein arginine kinase activator
MLLCEECRKRPAAVHITKIVNNVKTEMHLCQECAQTKGELNMSFEPSLTFENFLKGMLQQAQALSQGPAVGIRPQRCPNCGHAYGQFKESGRLGCSECYEEFKGEIVPLVRRIQGSVGHTGKAPGISSAAAGYRQQIEELREQQRKAIIEEKYEEAAKLRDKIRALEKSLREAEKQEGR